MKVLIPSIISGITRVIMSKPSTTAMYKKIRISRMNKDKSYYVESFTDKQAFQQSISQDKLEQFLISEISINYKQVLINTENEIINILTSKKGKNTILRKAINQDIYSSKPFSFNREKKYIIAEGTPVPFLVHLGVMSQEGKVLADKYDKFKQINRFLEYVDDIIPQIEENAKKENRPIYITDFGCGKSYLTFAIYHYLTVIRKIKTEIYGLDLKDDVITFCNTLSKVCGYEHLNFLYGDIAAYREAAKKNIHSSNSIKPDLVITLHACDTATDYALAFAIEQKAKVILSVPCCQHELNTKLSSSGCNDKALNSILKYGILKERFSALATDAIRAEILENNNYATQILEFIDMTHTPKNLLIRAILRGDNEKPKATSKNDIKYLDEALNQKLTLEKILEK